MTQQRTAVAYLVLAVTAYFAAASYDAKVVFGRREYTKQLNQGAGQANRIAIRAGDDAGNAGEITDPLNLGDTPQNLGTFEHVLDVSCWGVDTTAPNDELAQHEAAHALFLKFVQALRKTMRADAACSSPRFVVVPVENVFGACLIVRVVVKGTMPDLTDDIVNPELLDLSDRHFVT